MLLVDWTHVTRRATGIERITSELFSAAALAPLPVRTVAGTGQRAAMVARQQLLLPALAVANRSDVIVFPGYPPALSFRLLRDRTVMYVHDLFLITRQNDLNTAGRYYLAPQFKQAVRGLKYFLTNSVTTARELAGHVAVDAQIRTYRPSVRNVFGLVPNTMGRGSSQPLVVGTVGTIEPRKNLRAAADICAALAARLGRPVEFHVVGRQGWGDDVAALSAMPHVRLLGFLGDELARTAIGRFDVFLSTSHDEGLGLPLLETQYAGLPVAAPDKQVFREVLGDTGTFLNPADPGRAAEALAALVTAPDWRQRAADLAIRNIDRWNSAAARDLVDVIAFFQTLMDETARRSDRVT